jgi:CubicO group peptidase (beta-lactamase class C family)
MRSVVSGLAVLLAAVALSPARAGTDGVPKAAPKTTDELAESLRGVLKETKTPGLGVALVSKDGVLWQSGLGLADVAKARAATADTLFRIGSISKTFVSLSVLMLVEEGRLSLDATVRSVVPDVAFANPWEAGEPVRVVHLLEHTTGFDDLSLREYALNEPALSLRDGLAFRPDSRVSRWRPGTRMSYCNSGPPIAAYAIETVTGRRFEAFVQERIFAPLGMTTASYLKDPATDDRRATLYRDDGATPYPYWHIAVRPSGAINASAADMARFARLLIGRGTLEGRRLVSPESIARMERPSSTWAAKAGLPTGYGLGNYTTLEKGFVWHGHDGGVEGGLAKLEYLADPGLGFVLMINGGSGKALRDAGALVRGYLTRDVPRPSPPVAARVPEDVQRAWTGYYRVDNPRQEVSRAILRLLAIARVDVAAGGLTTKGLFEKTPDEFVAVTDRLFRKKDSPAPSLVLLDTSEGRMIQDGRQNLAAAPAWRVFGELALAAASILLLASAPLFALVWVPRRFLGRMEGVLYLGARGWGLAASLSLLGALALFAAGLSDPFRRLGHPTVWSVGYAVLSVAFVVAAAAAAVTASRAPVAEQNHWAAWHGRLVAAAAVLVAAYFAWFGLIGLRTWV